MDRTQPLAFRYHRAWIAESGGAAIAWSSRSEAWIVYDAAIGHGLLRSKGFDAVEYSPALAMLGGDIHVDTSAAETIIACVPFATNGDRHAALRRSMATTLHDRSHEALARYRLAVDAGTAQIASATESVDLFAAIIEPAVGLLIAALSGIDGCPFHRDISPSQSFGMRKPISARRLSQLNVHSEVLLAAARMQGRDAPGSAEMAAALRLVGLDVLTGTLGESLICELNRHAGAPLADIPWSVRPPVSALPYVERVATLPHVVAGQSIAAGDRVIIYIGAFDPDDTALHFGAGRHLCVGKALAEEAWRSLTAALATQTAALAVEAVRYREFDYTFSIPIEIRVRVDHVRRAYAYRGSSEGSAGHRRQGGPD